MKFTISNFYIHFCSVYLHSPSCVKHKIKTDCIYFLNAHSWTYCSFISACYLKEKHDTKKLYSVLKATFHNHNNPDRHNKELSNIFFFIEYPVSLKKSHYRHKMGFKCHFMFISKQYNYPS